MRKILDYHKRVFQVVKHNWKGSVFLPILFVVGLLRNICE